MPPPITRHWRGEVRDITNRSSRTCPITRHWRGEVMVAKVAPKGPIWEGVTHDTRGFPDLVQSVSDLGLFAVFDDVHQVGPQLLQLMEADPGHHVLPHHHGRDELLRVLHRRHAAAGDRKQRQIIENFMFQENVLFCLNLGPFGPFGPLQDREG